MTRRPYLIEPAPARRKYLVAKTVREDLQWILLPLSMISSAVDWYLSDLDHMLDAGAIYLGPGK